MPYAPFPISRFTGLNMLVDPMDLGWDGATNIVNVDLRDETRLKGRPGYTTIGTTSTNFGITALQTSAGLNYLIIGAGGQWTAYAGPGTLGTGAASLTSSTSDPEIRNPVRFGDPSDEYVFWGSDLGVQYFKAPSTMSSVSGFTSALAVGIMANSNRLVVASGGSHLDFSAAGDPLTFPGFTLELTPGDGSAVKGIANWQNDTYVFKHDRFFVFSGESTTQAGTPLFQYRTVDGYGAVIPPAAGHEGVYFFDGRNVWVTTGGLPQRISDPIAPLFDGQHLPFSAGEWWVDRTAPELAQMWYAFDRLFVSVKYEYQDQLTSGDGYMVLVYDPAVNAWSIWDLDSRFGTPGGYDGFNMPFMYVTGGFHSHIRMLDLRLTGDDLSTTQPQFGYTTGFNDMGSSDRKVIREVQAWATVVDSVSVAIFPQNEAGAPNPGLFVNTPGSGLFRHRVSGRSGRFQAAIGGGPGDVIESVTAYVRDTESQK